MRRTWSGVRVGVIGWAVGCASPQAGVEVAGVSCWDLDADGVADLPAEDVDGDGVVDVRDCRGAAGSAGADGAAVALPASCTAGSVLTVDGAGEVACTTIDALLGAAPSAFATAAEVSALESDVDALVDRVDTVEADLAEVMGSRIAWDDLVPGGGRATLIGASDADEQPLTVDLSRFGVSLAAGVIDNQQSASFLLDVSAGERANRWNDLTAIVRVWGSTGVSCDLIANEHVEASSADRSFLYVTRVANTPQIKLWSKSGTDMAALPSTDRGSCQKSPVPSGGSRSQMKTLRGRIGLLTCDEC